MTLLTYLQTLLPDAHFHTNPRHPGLQSDYDSIWHENLSDEHIKKMSKTLLNFIYGSDYGYITEAKKEYIDTDGTSIPIDEWDEIPENVLCGALKVSDILDDATTYGLSFKYENGKYYIKPNECDPN